MPAVRYAWWYAYALRAVFTPALPAGRAWSGSSPLLPIKPVSVTHKLVSATVSRRKLQGISEKAAWRIKSRNAAKSK
jgi:hypothetical protein